MKNRVLILMLVAILAGGLVTGVSYVKIKDKQNKELDTKPVVVMVGDVEAFSVISEDNLKTAYVSSKFIDEFIATDIRQVKGKISTTPLYKDKPIDVRVITEKSSDVGNKQVVGVNIDYVRFAGVTVGDIVDVYWLDNNIVAERIARNAEVVRIADEKLIPLSAAASAGIIEGKNPKVVYLRIKPEEVQRVIMGSTPGNTNISLSKKSAEDFEEQVIEVEETEEERVKNNRRN